MTLPLLNGEVIQEGEDPQIERLRNRIEELEGELEVSRVEARNAKRGAERAVSALRQQLSPLYQALRAVFGEMDAVIPESNNGSGPQAKSDVWEKWKRQLGGKPAEFIAAMQEHGEMTIPQLRVATHSGQQTCYDVTSKLNKLGLINKNGGKYSLKSL